MTAPMHDHQESERLWRLARGESDPALEAHVAGCEPCRAELVALRALAGYRATTGGAMPEPPATLLAATTGLFRRVRPDLLTTQPTLRDRLEGVLRRITAELILDTGAAPATAGLRSGHSRQTRQLAFVSALGDLDLEIVAGDSAGDVAGQLGMDEVPPGLVIRFTPVRPDGEAVEAAVAGNGAFRLVLPVGEWVASVQLNDAVLHFPGVRI